MSSNTDADQFELELQKFDVRSSADVDIIGQLLGLNGGGGWWLNPYESADEVDSDEHIIEGAVAEIESHVRIWLRHSFDNNPVFRDNSYHLLSRLNELARLQGLVEEVALKYHQFESSPRPSFSTEKEGSSHAHTFGDPARHCQNSGRNSRTSSNDNSKYDTFTKNVLGVTSFRRPPLPDAYQDSQPADDHVYLKNPAASRNFVKSSGLPRLHKSQQPPSPHNNQLQRSHLYNRRVSVRASSATPTPSASSGHPNNLTSHLEYRFGSLNRTYSKEALDQLKEIDIPPARRSGGSLLDNFLRNSNNSGAGSDSEGVIEVSRSFDSMGFATNILSKSLTDGEIFGLHLSGIKPNTSFSSMKSANVLEMALFQEAQLRKLSGSRGKLSGSNSSLTASSVDAEGFLHPTNLILNSNDSAKSLDTDFTADTYNGVALRRPSAQPSLSDPTHCQDSAKDIVILSHILTESSTLPVSEPQTPVINSDLQINSTNSCQGNTADPPTVRCRHSQQNTFFPDETFAMKTGHYGKTGGEFRLDRLSSFELMETCASQEHFTPGNLVSSLEDDTVIREMPIGPSYLGPPVSSEFSNNLPGRTVESGISKRHIPSTPETTELRPQSKIPFHPAGGAPSVCTTDFSASSRKLPTFGMRSRTGLNKSSTHDYLSRPSSNQIGVPSQLHNHSSNFTPSLTHHDYLGSLSSKPCGPSRSLTKAPDKPGHTVSNNNITQPKASRSNVSPARSRRFGPDVSEVSGTRRTRWHHELH